MEQSIYFKFDVKLYKTISKMFQSLKKKKLKGWYSIPDITKYWLSRFKDTRKHKKTFIQRRWYLLKKVQQILDKLQMWFLKCHFGVKWVLCSNIAKETIFNEKIKSQSGYKETRYK